MFPETLTNAVNELEEKHIIIISDDPEFNKGI